MHSLRWAKIFKQASKTAQWRLDYGNCYIWFHGWGLVWCLL